MASWTEKRVERLKLLHKEGFSATSIAKKLGPDFTKGIGGGKDPPSRPDGNPGQEGACHTRGQATQPPAPSAAPVTIIVPRAVPRMPTPPVGVAVSNGIRIYDLRAGHCRWPLGDDRPAKFFCGAPVVPSKSWCEHHYGLAYGHRPTHQNREREGSPGQMLLRALQRRSKWRQVEAVQRST
jgi:hypothetical protein